MVEYVKQEMSGELNHSKGESMACYRLKTYANMDMDQFVEFVVRNEGVKEGDVRGIVAALTQQIAFVLSMGETVTIDGLGTFRASVGVVKGKEQDGFEDEEQRRNARSIGVRNVLFKADKRFVRQVNGMMRLERGEEQRISRPSTTESERLQKLKAFLGKYAFAKVVDYMELTGLNRSAATRELRRFRLDPESGIAVSGRGSHKVIVLRGEG